jgi:chemosensory pili system protein ChpC
MSNSNVRSLLLQVTGGQILIPSAVVAEVLSYQSSEAVPDSPAWLGGILRWRGQSLPVIQIEHLLGIPFKDASHKRIVVFYGIYTPDALPFYAILAKEMPSSITINATSLSNPKAIKRAGILASANIQERSVWLPDLEYLEQLLQKYHPAAK